jgi:hypothetical protein
MTQRLFLDIEVYHNYFLAQFMNEKQQTKKFEIFNDDVSGFNADVLFDLITSPEVEIVTFNGNSKTCQQPDHRERVATLGLLSKRGSQAA